MAHLRGVSVETLLAAVLCACGSGNPAGGGDDGGTTEGGDTTSDAAGSESGTTDPDVEVPEEGVPVAGLRRLTRHEYDNTVHDLLGDDSRPGGSLPEDQLTPFDNDASTQQASQLLIESAEALARDLAQSLVADVDRRDLVVACDPSPECAREFIARFGRRALRRPLDDAEIVELADLASQFAVEQNDFYAGVEVVVRTLLQDGEFLYRVERGAPVDGIDGVYRLGPFERATRMAYLIWGSTPNGWLLDLAEDGALESSDDLRDAAALMLDDSRAPAQLDRFHALWLGYHSLPHSPTLVNAMRTESASLLERVVFEDQAPWTDLFISPQSYINDELAQLYGLPAPGGWAWVDTSGGGRLGVLSHGSFLSVAANPGDTSPTKRGILIRERLLCEEIPAPPPNVDVDNPPAGDPGDCKVDRYAAHRADAACKGCHEQIDPIGFGLENYDREGRFRAHDDGAPQCTIDGTGDVVGIGSFSGPAELGALLSGEPSFGACAAQHLLQFALGKEIESEDAALLATLSAHFEDGGHRFDELVLELVSHDAFGFRREG